MAKLVLIAAMTALLAACAVAFDAGSMLEAAFGENGRANYAYEEFSYKSKDGKKIIRTKMGGERSTLDQELAEKLVKPFVF